jgi:hypothetical protein
VRLYEQALTQYDIKPYSGELILFLTDRHPAGSPDHLGGWAEVAQGGFGSGYFRFPLILDDMTSPGRRRSNLPHCSTVVLTWP